MRSLGASAVHQVHRMLLLTPGPVTTRPEVRAALGHDFAPWDNDFRPLYAGVRERLLRIAKGDTGQHAVLPLQGCGHFITEAAIRTFVPPGGKLLIPGHRRLFRPNDPAGARGRPHPGAAADRADRTDRPRGGCRRPGRRSGHQPCRPGVFRDRQRRGARSRRRRRGGAPGRAAADRRCGVGVRRAAAGRRRRSRRSTPRCSPPTNAWKACPAWPSPWRASTA